VNVSDLDGSDGAISCSPVPFEQRLDDFERDTEPMVAFLDADDELIGSIYFPKARFSKVTVQRLSENFLRLLEELLMRPGRHIQDIPL
jgi:hypothetical protein